MVRGCWLRNADIVSCSLGHNWTVSLRDMDFCAPHSQHRPRTGNKLKSIYLLKFFAVQRKFFTLRLCLYSKGCILAVEC